MKHSEKTLVIVAVLLLLGIVGLNFYVGENFQTDSSGNILQKKSNSLLTGAAIGVQEATLSDEVQLSSSNLGVSDFANCWAYSNTDNATCVTSGGENCIWRTTAEDPFCDSQYNPNGCCMDKGCWLYAGTDSSTCLANDGTMNCTWDPYMAMWYPNGTQGDMGGCVMDWMSSDGDWGGVAEGCWQYEGDKASCNAQGATCRWTANDQNQEPWCIIKTLTDAQKKNPAATTTDIGCCEQTGCWMHDNNESNCLAAFQGNCFYTNNSYGGGWCNTKSCNEITTEANCTYAKQNLMMPCNWNVDHCEDFGGNGMGGFAFYNDSDSCLNKGGWYNSTGSCVMPDGGISGGSGGFMFAGEAHCWFADNNPSVCGNLTGCAYCVAGDGATGIDNSSNDNICKDKEIGLCEGHALGDPTYSNANNSANLACTDIQIKSACNYGPLPNCKWTNSSTTIGAFCEAGAKSEKKSAPPAQYCEDPMAKNNYTICMQLVEEFMMPCKWQNTTIPYTNCTFNGNAVFGGSGGEMDFGLINSEFSCTSAGGTWTTENYIDGDILKQDSWCEMIGMFNIDQGQGTNNKANCDTSCWACEFQNNGSAWGGVAAAQSACQGSALGNCQWTTDSSAFNGFGFCDYPKEMENGGAKDCNFQCEGCNFMNNPQAACLGSMANDGIGCKWENNTNDLIKGGFCVDKSKKTCNSDCFSCYDTTSCDASSLDCIWDPTFNLCKANGFTGEVCFNGVDDDSDTLMDCADPDCGFDNFCGGSSFGGDCFAQTTPGNCNTTVAFGDLNCTWINDTWNPTGWCDMPGANCWRFNNDLSTCGATPGCTNDSSSMGNNAWCEINESIMQASNCWSGSTEVACGELSGCQWTNNTWPGAPAGSGFCDNTIFASCKSLTSDTCSLNSNCSWREDTYSANGGGWCDVACMNPELDQSSCEGIASGSLCRWRDMSSTCQPENFMMMGSSSDGGFGGKTGCGQYDGNLTACNNNNVTCVYKQDGFANNGVAPANEAGWCVNKAEFEHFGEMEGDVIDLAMDTGNNFGQYGPEAESGVDDWVDILGMGMRVTDTGFDFGAGIFNITSTAMCNGYMIGNKDDFMAQKVQGNGIETTKFYWYLDTDGISNNGCIAVNQLGSTLTGFEFMVGYVSTNTSNGIVETKQMKRCSEGNWNPTNALVTTSKMLSCGEIGGPMIAIAKQDLESFSEYNKTANLRIFMSSANDSTNRTSPSDSVGPGYYTPGTVDFGFVDCSNPSNSKDPKCKNFQKFGFNVFEECKNGVDDDENGLIDCDDPFCSFIPDCNGGTGFNFVADSNDKTAPTVMFSKVEKLFDAAFLKVDTSEPSNLSIGFYTNDSTCKTLNMTLVDIGEGYQANANFKPFHSIDLMEDNLGFALINNTIYYYKITVCDPSGNCGVSACSNFTTKATAEEKTFIFKIELPDEGGYTVDIPALGKVGYNFTETFDINGVPTVFDVGIKTNTSVTKNMNMTIHCGDLAIGFFGINMLSPTKIDLSSAFVCDALNDLMGMNSTSKKWNKLIDDLHLGGATDYVEVTIPVAYSASNSLSWTDDDGTSGQDVDDYVECRDGGSSNTICKIPVSMGFSAYTITAAAVASPDGGSSGSGGGSGGGAVAGMTYLVSEEQFKAGYTKSLGTSDRFKFAVGAEMHYLTLNATYSDRVKVIVESTPQTLVVYTGKTVLVELDGDQYYDLSVKLNSINLSGSQANLTIKIVHELVPVVSANAEQAEPNTIGETEQTNADTPGEALGDALAETDASPSRATALWVALGIVVLALIAGIVSFVVNRRKAQKAIITKRK
ncbi:hypothetical protein COY27_01975 [Candidatus Woesearchaeota archaeon CG_4_10_14_0_2_um_filter_33_13]|nr:MAG: hypothetical protein COY27_01975 [Candidatus Woesearchaeota archaeon CG_4_10_14_0_2_um_filter_33_13]